MVAARQRVDSGAPRSLLVTNGDSAVEVLRRAGLGTDFLPWADVLHDGPVPAGLSLTQLSERRASFIAGMAEMDLSTIRERFRHRDDVLFRHAEWREVVLWFEHDLYDQLQLLQLLDFFSRRIGEGPPIRLAQADDFIAMLSLEEVGRLDRSKSLVTEDQMDIGARAWAAFRAPTPVPLAHFLNHDLSPLPHLSQALRRLLEELPGVETGLARTERQILEGLQDGAVPAGDLFGSVQRCEEAAFMGDSSFWIWLNGLAAQPQLVRPLACEGGASTIGPHDPITLTRLGRDVLAAEEDRVRACGIDRWWGGTHLVGPACWRWDATTGIPVES